MNTWNDIEHGFAPARATQYTASDADQLAATLYKLFHGRYVKSDNGHIITLSDGISITITLGDGNTGADSASAGAGAHGQDMRAHADRRIIERAHLNTNTNHAGTITGLSLILFYQGETVPATIRAAHADIATGVFAAARDKSKPLATIRVALTQKQIDAWVTREQQALADMLTGETITGATDGVFTIAARETDNNDRNSDTIRNSDNENTREADTTNTGDAHTITVHATLNNQPRTNKGSRHATTVTLPDGHTIGPITHAWVTRTRVQDTREQPTNADKTQPMTENTTITGSDDTTSSRAASNTRRNRRETTVITLHATTPGSPTPIDLYTSVYSGRTAQHGLTIEHSDGRSINGEAAATHTTIRLPHK